MNVQKMKQAKIGIEPTTTPAPVQPHANAQESINSTIFDDVAYNVKPSQAY